MLLSSSHLLATHDCQLGVTVGNRRTGSFGIECLFLVTEGGVTVHHRDPLSRRLDACRPRPLTPPRPPPRYSPAGSLFFFRLAI